MCLAVYPALHYLSLYWQINPQRAGTELCGTNIININIIADALAPQIYISFLLTDWTDVVEFLPHIKQGLDLFYIVNIIDADVLATQGTTRPIQ